MLLGLFLYVCLSLVVFLLLTAVVAAVSAAALPRRREGEKRQSPDPYCLGMD